MNFGIKPFMLWCLLITISYLLNVSLHYHFDMSYDEYTGIFNKLTSVKIYAFNYYKRKPLKTFKNSYMFKSGGVLNTLGIFKTNGLSNNC